MVPDAGYRAFLEARLAEKERLAQAIADDLAADERSEQRDRTRMALRSLAEEEVYRDTEDAVRESLRARGRARLESVFASVQALHEAAAAAVETRQRVCGEIQEKRHEAHERIRESVAMAVDFFAATQTDRPSREALLEKPLNVYDDAVPVDRLKELVRQLPQADDGIFTAEQCEEARRVFVEVDKTYPLTSIHVWERGSLESLPRFASFLKRYEVLTQEQGMLRGEADRLAADLRKQGIAPDDVEGHPEMVALVDRVRDCDQKLQALNEEAETAFAPTMALKSHLHDIDRSLERVRAGIAGTPVALAIEECAALRAICLQPDAVRLAGQWILGEYQRSEGEYRDQLWRGRYLESDGTPSATEMARELDGALSPLLVQDLWRELAHGLRPDPDGADQKHVEAQKELRAYLGQANLTEEQEAALGGENGPIARFFKADKSSGTYGNPRFHELAKGKARFHLAPLHRMELSLTKEVFGLEAVTDPAFAAVLRGYERVMKAGGSLSFYERFASEAEEDGERLNEVEAVAIELTQAKQAEALLERIRHAAPHLRGHDFQIIADLLREKAPESEDILEEYLLSISHVGIPETAQAQERVRRLKTLGLPLEYRWNDYFAESGSGAEAVYVNAILGFDAPTQARWARVLRGLPLTYPLRNAIGRCRHLPDQGLEYLERLIFAREGAENAKDPSLAMEVFVRTTVLIKSHKQVEETPAARAPDSFARVVAVLERASPRVVRVIEENPRFYAGSLDRLEVVAVVLEEAINEPRWEQMSPKLQQESLLGLGNLPRERWGSYLDLLQRLDQAPSQAIQRVKMELAREVSAAPDPEKSYERVVDIFIRNNLPTVGKIFRVFEILHPDEVLEHKLEATYLCPTLRVSGPRERMTLIGNDLLRIHLESGNEELRRYLQAIAGSERLPDIQTPADLAALTPETRKDWESFVRKLRTLVESSTLGSFVEAQEKERAAAGERPEDLLHAFLAWKQDIGLRPDQSIKERLEEMFLRAVGLSSVEEAIAFMDASKRQADERNRALAAASGGHVVLRAGDLLKGFDEGYFGSILQNGSVAKEFLGASSDSDMTPLDTDLSLVLEKDLRKGIPGAIDASLAKEYGRVLMVFRPDKAWRTTTAAMDRVSLQRAARQRTDAPLELFQTGFLGERHYGVRTGLAMTHANLLIVRGEPIPADLLRNLKMEIVQNNQYLPIADTEGKILFTPTEFDAYRERFSAGTRRSGLPAFEYRPATEIQSEIHGIREELRTAEPRLERIRADLREKIQTVLERMGVLRDGAPLDLKDAGSSGRMTGDPASSVDFDFCLRVDPVSFRRVHEVMSELTTALGGKPNEKPGEETTIRLVEAPSEGEKIEVDLKVLPQTELSTYESSLAVEDRLASVERRYGAEAREEVAANIVYAKRFLKAAHAYKILEDGGLGGIGVENWILSHHGSFTEAARAFLAAATGKDGAIRSYEAFRARYELLDAGVDAKSNEHRDFLNYLKPATYETMAQALRTRLTEITPTPEPPTETPPV